MELNDARIEVAKLHNQVVYLPSAEGWKALLGGEPLGRSRLQMRWWIDAWQKQFGAFEVARLGLTLQENRWAIVPLLHLSGEWYRVHFEDVICEHCEKQCGPSAVPQADAYAGTGLT